MADTVLNPEPIARALQGAFCGDASRKELLELVATKIRAAGSPYSGVYMYMLHGDELVLEAFDGRPTDHTRIPVGEGMCGRAVAERRDLNIPDVTQAEGYLSCSVETRSELVVLVRRHDEILGQIDIDSDVPNGFDEAEEHAVRKVADALAALL
ncbi:MAG: GAF domain-containing protein [Gemmatimonadales bacterium]|jgi:GAF domain-containing protein